MKKKYVVPSFMCMKVDMTQMICASLDGGTDGEGRTADTHQRYINFEDDEDM